MLGKTLSTAVVALAAAGLASAQTFTTCNPLKKSCPADPAFAGETSCDFTKGACSIFSSAEGTELTYDERGASFEIMTETNAPTIHTGKYIFFGRVDVVVQAAAGQGIVTSAVLQSDDLDEIDWEWVGGDNAQVQTNYFSKGDTTTYDRGAYHPVGNPLGSYHTYTVEWTSKAINWIIDGNVVRTLTAADAKGGAAYPQTPMQIKLGTWCAGGKNTPEGTVQWAGGYTDFDKAPFNAYYKSIKIVDYAGKDAPGDNSDVKEYVYGDNSGSWQSIKIVKGDGSNTDTTTSGTKTASATGTATSKTGSATGTATSTTGTATGTATGTKTETKASSTSVASETKTVPQTTFSTVAATTTIITSTKTGGDSPAQTTGAATTGGSEKPTTVPTAGAGRLSTSFSLAAGALFLAQLFL